MMGASKSKLDEDKALQLCRARKKFIKQALNGRCSLAAAHITYIEQLKVVGHALTSFVETDNEAESSNSPTPVSHLFMERSPSPSVNTFSSPSSPFSFEYKTHHVTPRSQPSLKTAASTPSESAPWDYFSLSHPIDSQFSSQEKKFDEAGDVGADDEVSKLEDVEEKYFSKEIEAAQLSENGPLSSPLVLDDSSVRSSGTLVTVGNMQNSPQLSPLPAAPSAYMHLNDVKITPLSLENNEDEDIVAPKDFISSMKAVEKIFIAASESGKEVPKMLEANKFRFRLIFSGKEGTYASFLSSGSMARSVLKSCFACGKDAAEVPKELPQNSVKYLRWNRTTSTLSTSSRFLLGANSVDSGDPGGHLFENFFMNSGSHASTLDRLYAWEKKLCDEVKAAQVLRCIFDQKCRMLRQVESRGVNTDKVRTAVKDVHSRIGVAIHRIDSISKKIEEIRDMELQPQLEELIEGLQKMWETMVHCHKLQFHIISISHAPRTVTLSMQSENRRQIAIYLERELNTLLSTFTEWCTAQKLYVDTIDKWLLKCFLLPQNPAGRRKRVRNPPIRKFGPPIYMTCEAWLKMMDELPSKGVADSVKNLISEVAHFLPHQEKKTERHSSNSDGIIGASSEAPSALERFHTSLAVFLGQLSSFAEACAEKYAAVQKEVRLACDDRHLACGGSNPEPESERRGRKNGKQN